MGDPDRRASHEAGGDARFGTQALVHAVRVEVFGLERGLLGQLLRLLAAPTTCSRALVQGADRPIATALRLFLVANLVFFLVGPSVGLMNYTLDSLAGAPGYAEVIRDQIARLGWSVELYRARFEAAFDVRQPTLVIVMVPLLAVASGVALRRSPGGKHLMVAFLGLAWILLVWPVVRILGAAVEALGISIAVTAPATLALLVGSAVWVWSRLGRGVFDLGVAARWGYGALLTAALALAAVVHGQLSFWVTFALLEVGG